uniref:Uncharacterized protein n=1 Tax=Aureoumbra lagunensis TaxID=44058 RepID=A0A7S3JXJ9_9STRA|mmetsp:Transcript_11581/g.17278  ORF Transcript_11581/g.17278 Transcript_11581/m.17278 type:complete len:864 (+) Transcript_11581:69-2660(+)
MSSSEVRASCLREVPEVTMNNMDMCQIELGPKIGEGQFAKVFIARLAGEYVAVKKQLTDESDEEEMTMAKYLKLEVSVLAFCSHPNILKYIGCCLTQEKEDNGNDIKVTWIVTEYVACGDLLRLLEDKSTDIEWYMRLRMSRELGDAVSYLHSRNLMHRDIKSSNVLLDGAWHVKLGDFGMATEVHNGRASTICGTNEYMAPELHFGETESYSLSIDVFSLGMVFLEIGTRTKASVLAPRSPRDRFQLDEQHLRNELQKQCSINSYCELAMQCVAYEDYDRIGAEDAAAWLEELVLELPESAAISPPTNLEPGTLETLMDAQSDSDRSGFSGSMNNNTMTASFQQSMSGTNTDELLSRSPENNNQDDASHISEQAMASPTDKEPRRSLLNIDLSKNDKISTERESLTTRGSGQNLNLVATRRIQSLREVGIETTRMAGWLNKKTRNSLRSRYNKRWFVVKRKTLTWFSKPGIANAMGRLALAANHELVSTGPTKFAIYATSSSTKNVGSGISSRSRKAVLELSAVDETAKDMWLQALQTEIDERAAEQAANTNSRSPNLRTSSGGGMLTPVQSPGGSSARGSSLGGSTQHRRTSSTQRPSPSVDSVGTDESPILARSQRGVSPALTEIKSIASTTKSAQKYSTTPRLDLGTWIEALRLPPETTLKFKQAGYNDVEMIFDMGLTDEDLDFIGVINPMHRRLLRGAIEGGSYAETIESKVIDYRICGTVALYGIKSHYKFRKSHLHLRYANFVTLFAKLRSIERERKHTSSPFTDHGDPLPKLPGSRLFVDQKGPLFLEQRRKELDDYLQKTIAVASQDPRLLQAILSFLELADVDTVKNFAAVLPAPPPRGLTITSPPPSVGGA